MGCVSSTFLEDEDGNVAPGISHHIVSLTSTTYGLLTTLDQQQPPQQTSLRSLTPQQPPTSPPPPLPSARAPFTPRLEPEVINAWELMAGLDSTPFKTPMSSPVSTPKSRSLNNKAVTHPGKENVHRALAFPPSEQETKSNIPKPLSSACVLPPETQVPERWSLDMLEMLCPPGGENAVVLYTTTLRGIRKTFEDCNLVRSALEGLGVCIRERDVSMDMGFREELRELMKGIKEDCTGVAATVPRVFVKGRYIGGADEVLRFHEERVLAKLVEGLPKATRSTVRGCEGCGGARFLPCFQCRGSRKVVVPVEGEKGCKGKVVRCPECNENGLVLCPICY